jgi:hypothetical protein
MAPSSTTLFLLASNASYLLAAGVLVWRGAWAKYYAETTLLLLVTLSSCNYHLCWSDDVAWCEESRDVAYARDVLAACQALSVLSVVIDAWAGPFYPRARALYFLAANLMAAVLVVLIGYTLSTFVLLGLLHGGTLLWALVLEVRFGARQLTGRWLTKLLLGALLALAALAVQFANLSHPAWHLLSGLSVAVLLELATQTSPPPSLYARV